MAELKFTKQELRQQQIRLLQLQRYLPTLQLRKALLQVEVATAKSQRDELCQKCQEQWQVVSKVAPLIGLAMTMPIHDYARIAHIEKIHENIAGVEVPLLKTVTFDPIEYDFYDSPPWIEGFIEELQLFRSLEAKSSVAEERLSILTRELREVYIRVNLFEKVLIPRCVKNMKSIKIFLGDLQLAAISQAKIAKTKILAKKSAEEREAIA
jgi:V/A-type H+-transporting ATPase subunit D